MCLKFAEEVFDGILNWICFPMSRSLSNIRGLWVNKSHMFSGVNTLFALYLQLCVNLHWLKQINNCMDSKNNHRHEN